MSWTTKSKALLAIFICLISLGFARAQAQSSSITDIIVSKDPGTGDIIVTFREDGKAYRFVFQPTNKFEAVVSVGAWFDPKKLHFFYLYKIDNKPQSKQPIGSFYVLSPQVVREVRQPDDWEDMHANLPRSMKVTIPPGAAWLAGKGRISPGKSKGGFSFASEHPPGITESQLEGRPMEDEDFGDYPGGEPPLQVVEVYRPVVTSRENEYVIKKTVGPVPVEGASEPATLLSRLIGLKEQAFELGWIDNQGVANSLNKKLAHAQRRLLDGQKAAAVNILHALVHELQAQRGKHVNDNAFYLLKPNIEFLIFKIESR